MNNIQNNSLLDELISEHEIKEDPLEKTLEIENFELDEDEKEILKTEAPKPEKKKRWWHLPITTAKDHHLEYAFVHCSVLGFVTAFIGAGMLTYIINHI